MSTYLTEDSDLTKKFRANHAYLNNMRLILFRSRRLILRTRDFISMNSNFHKYLDPIDTYGNTPVLYIGWLFFLPRLLFNIHDIIKNRANLLEAIRKHWFEVLNDGVLFISGILNCFVFINHLEYIAPYMSFATQLFETINATIRLIVVSHYKEKYHPNKSQEFIEFEQFRLALNILNNAIQTLCMCLFLPGSSHVAMMAGAIILLTSTIIWILLQSPIENKKASLAVANIKNPVPTSSPTTESVKPVANFTILTTPPTPPPTPPPTAPK